MQRQNLFADIPDRLAAELFTELPTSSRLLKIERIVSLGHCTPLGEWYDQTWHEWICLISGSAGLLFEHERQPRRLGAGDHLDIPAGCRHRVEWTHPEMETIWLAVHYAPVEEPT